MLTGPLIRARVQRGTIRPSLVDPTGSSLVEGATALCELFADAVQHRWPRRQIDAAVDDLVGDRRDHKIVRGLAKLLFDRSSFEVESAVDPTELRAEVFRRAQSSAPLSLEAGPLGRATADDVLTEVAEARGLTVQQVRDGLYADLREEQRIESCRVDGPEWLAPRYNVALVQALLLKTTEVTIELRDPSAPRMRQLFRFIKFHQLIHLAQRKGDTLTVHLDGPASLFTQSTRYGLQLANFFPALLLQECPWELTATVLWTRARHRKQMTITSEDALQSHYADKGAYRTREQQWFAERFAARDTPWTLAEGDRPIDLGGQAVVFPDFTLTCGDRRAHLDIVGFWRKDYLHRRLELLEQYGPGNLVVAISRKLRGSREKLSEFPGAVVEFAEILPPAKVIEACERVAR